MMVKIKKYMLMGFMCSVCFMVPYTLGKIVGSEHGIDLLLMFLGGCAWITVYDIVWVMEEVSDET